MATVFRPPLVTRTARPDSRVAVNSQEWIQATSFWLSTGQKPFAQNDWPVPRGYVPNITLRTHTSRFQNPDSAIAFHQTEWPVPRGYVPSIGLRTHTATFQNADSAIAFHQNDWPNPVLRLDRAPQTRSWVSLPQIVPPFVQPPFFQTDWPVPKGYQFSIGLRTFINLTQIQLIGKDAMTVGRMTDWPIPRGPRNDIARIVLGPNLLTTTLVPPATSGLYDFWHYYSP